VQDKVARRLGLDVIRRPGLTVKVANGERVPSQGVCRATQLEIDGVPFDIGCYTLALDGFDVILGVQWLRTLGPITWDLNKLTMAIWHDGRSVVWRGMGNPGPCVNTLANPRDFLDNLLA